MQCNLSFNFTELCSMENIADKLGYIYRNSIYL
jgi:hypothetical protein